MTNKYLFLLLLTIFQTPVFSSTIDQAINHGEDNLVFYEPMVLLQDPELLVQINGLVSSGIYTKNKSPYSSDVASISVLFGILMTLFCSYIFFLVPKLRKEYKLNIEPFSDYIYEFSIYRQNSMENGIKKKR
jgi:hypothetical protein